MASDLARALRERLGGKLVLADELTDRYYVYEDRLHAGRALAEVLAEALGGRECEVMAIPCGGVPVGYAVATELEAPMDLLVCRKVLIPWNREAGYGAVAPDGDVVINEALRRALGFSDDEVERHVEEALREVRRRLRLYRGGEEYVAVKEQVVVVDDGIASGYTMLAAVRFARRLEGVKRVVVAAPTASPSSLVLLGPHADLIVCPNVRSDAYGFAVAEAYVTWYDVPDGEVLDYLTKLGDAYVPRALGLWSGPQA